jgi:hypothetical protein
LIFSPTTREFIYFIKEKDKITKQKCAQNKLPSEQTLVFRWVGFLMSSATLNTRLFAHIDKEEEEDEDKVNY